MTGATCAAEMISLSGTPDFTPFGKFKISLMHDIIQNLSVLGLCLRIHDSGCLPGLVIFY